MGVAANIDINVRANTGSIQNGLDKTEKKLNHFKESVSSHAHGVEGRFTHMGEHMEHVFHSLHAANPLAKIFGSAMVFADSLAHAFTAAVPGIMAAASSMSALGIATTVATGGLNVLLAGLAATGVAAGAAGLAWGGMALHGMEGLDTLGKTADRIGMTTKSLAGLQHAASLADVSNETLDTSLMKMQRNLSEAAMGGGEAGKAITRLGLSADELKNKNADESFLTIAEAMNKVDNQADRVSTTMQIFGRGGSTMLTLMQEGTESLRKSMKEAGDLGLTVTRQQAAESEEARDAIDRVKAGFTGLFRTAAITMAPFVQMVADALTNLMKWINSFRERIINFVFTVEFVWKNFGEYAGLAFDYVIYRATKLANQLVHIFMEVIPDAFAAGWGAVVDVVSGKGLDAALSNAMSKIKRSLNSREEGGFEKALREQYEAKDHALAVKKKDFLEQKKKTLASHRGDESFGGDMKKEEGVAERGSQAAFKIIAKHQGDKMLKVANEQLAEARKSNKLLDKLLNKQAERLGRGKL